MVFVACNPERQESLKAYLQERGILIGGYGNLRLVTHLDVDPNDIPVVLAAFKSFFAAN